jgi:CRP-like cAMP-binding protein
MVRDVRFLPGEVLWRQGDASSYTLRVEHGLVDCKKDATVLTVGAGFTLGVMDSFARMPRAFDAVARTEVMTRQMDRDSLYSVIDSHPQVGLDLLAVVTLPLLRG